MFSEAQAVCPVTFELQTTNKVTTIATKAKQHLIGTDDATVIADCSY